MSLFNKKILATTLAAAIAGGFAQQATAANWLMLQGTEPAGETERVHVWGFIQVQYQKDNSDACTTGCGTGPGGTPVFTGYIPFTHFTYLFFIISQVINFFSQPTQKM